MYRGLSARSYLRTDRGGNGMYSASKGVMELYSGAGLFSVPIARAVGESGRVVTLEGDEGAVRDAGENLAAFDWVDTFAGNVDCEGVVDLSGQLGAVLDVIYFKERGHEAQYVQPVE